jgi:L-lysine exporter family protein LysE/ArgO
MTRRQATLAALAFAWLNPHAWLDTAVLIGTASIAWGHPGNAVFGVGAASGSALWFVGLGLCVLGMGQRMQSPAAWRALDGLVALMMWGTAITLGWDLLGL